jgi:membrane protein
MTKHKNEGKKLAIISLGIGLLVAGLKRRQIQESLSNNLSAPGTPAVLSLSDWKKVLVQTIRSLGTKNTSALAAGVSYYTTLALFPMLAAAVAIAALAITPAQLNELLNTTSAYLPEDISGVINAQLQNLVSRRSDNFIAAIIAIAVALFGASGAIKSLIVASNVAYDVKESRGWLAQQFWGVLWTIAGILFGFVLVCLLAINQSLLEYFGVSAPLISVLLYGRWIVILVAVVLGLSVFYKYGPDRQHARWQWVSWGAAIATIVWLIATSAFFVYVQNFANYTQSYSLFAGIIVLMIWLNLSALIILIGAEINHQLETIGQSKRIGIPFKHS